MKTIVILGAGESGTGAALLAVKKGYQVFVSDSSTIGSAYKHQLTVTISGPGYEKCAQTMNIPAKTPFP